MIEKKRETFVVEQAMQFKYALILGLSGLMVSVLVSLVFYGYMTAHSNVLLISGLDQSEEIVSFFARQQTLLIVKLLSISVIITLFLFLIGLLISNKVAGAVFSIKRKAEDIADTGDLSERFYIRKNDELNDLVQKLNKMMEKLDSKYGKAND